MQGSIAVGDMNRESILGMPAGSVIYRGTEKIGAQTIRMMFEYVPPGEGYETATYTIPDSYMRYFSRSDASARRLSARGSAAGSTRRGSSRCSIP